MSEPAVLVGLGALVLVVVAAIASSHREPSVRLTVTPHALPRPPRLEAALPSEPPPHPVGVPVAWSGDPARASLPIASGADPVLHRLLTPERSAANALTHPTNGVPAMAAVLARRREEEPPEGDSRVEWAQAETVGWPDSHVFTPVSSGGSATEAEEATGASPAAATSASGAAETPAETSVAQVPCEPERRALEARTAETAEARAVHDAAIAERRRLQRERDAAVARAEAANQAMDTRRMADDKSAAHDAYRTERASGHDPAAIQRAAARWLTTISDINVRARAAQRVAASERRRAARLTHEIDVGGPRVDAARIAAERAEAALAAARESLAECAERNAGALAAVAVAPPARPPTPERGAPSASVVAPDRGAIDAPAKDGTGSRREPVPEPTPPGMPGPEPAASRGWRPSLLSRILESDETAIAIAARALAPESIEEARRWHLELSAFRDALIETAVDAGLVDPPMDNAFWSGFTPEQAREVASVLASLGFRYDGRGAFADGRVPSTRDLALTVGYAGLDPLRIRRWPAPAELPGLLRGAHIAVVELVAQRAPALALSQFTDLLGPRARGLALLWDDWGRVRPILASPAP